MIGPEKLARQIPFYVISGSELLDSNTKQVLQWMWEEIQRVINNNAGLIIGIGTTTERDNYPTTNLLTNQLWWNSTTNNWNYWDGAAWQPQP